MPLWRRLAIVGLLGLVLSVAVWAFRPWTTALPLPPATNTSPQALYRCGAVFGADSVKASNEAARSDAALGLQPCTTRAARRALAVVDLIVGSVGLVALVAVRRPGSATVLASSERT